MGYASALRAVDSTIPLPSSLVHGVRTRQDKAFPRFSQAHTNEIEVILHGTITAHSAQLYEFNCSLGYQEIVKWLGTSRFLHTSWRITAASVVRVAASLWLLL